MKRSLKRSINLTGLSPNSGGAFSSYFQYNSTQGIKVLYSDGHKTIKSLIKSKVWQRATKENTLLRKCKQRYNNIPKTYGVYPIKAGLYYYPGIVMQHINGKTLHDARQYNSKQRQDIINKIYHALEKRGILHLDLHRGNVMICKDTNNYYVIDFTFDLVEIYNEEINGN